MDFPCYLAMTGAEFHNCEKFPRYPAYLSCHFSPYGKGLTAIPTDLPPDSMLILTDRTPICGHDPEQVADELTQAAKRLRCACILLDLQRPDVAEASAIVEAILRAAICPVGISALYASKEDHPVLVSPSPLWTPPEELLSPWQGRPIWLETVPEGAVVTVNAQGSHWEPIPFDAFTPRFYHARMCEDYRVECHQDFVKVYLRRDNKCLDSLADLSRKLGAVCRIGFYGQM